MKRSFAFYRRWSNRKSNRRRAGSLIFPRFSPTFWIVLLLLLLLPINPSRFSLPFLFFQRLYDYSNCDEKTYAFHRSTAWNLPYVGEKFISDTISYIQLCSGRLYFLSFRIKDKSKKIHTCNATTNVKSRENANNGKTSSTATKYISLLLYFTTKPNESVIPSQIYERTRRGLSVSVRTRLCLRDRSMQVYIRASRTRHRHRSIAPETNTSVSKKSNQRSVTSNLLAARKSNIEINDLNTKRRKRIFLRSKFVNSDSTNRTKRLTLLLRDRISREETRKGFSSEFPRGDIPYFSKGTVPERRYILRNAGSTATLFHRSPSMEHRFASLYLGCARVPTNKHWLVTAL